MVSWDYFKTIRRLNIPVWLKNCGIESYDDLVKVLRALGVSPPDISDTVEWFAKPKPTRKPRVVKKVAPKPLVEEEKPKRKPRRRKKVEEEVTEVKEDLDGES